jgi:hypothetical protein
MLLGIKKKKIKPTINRLKSMKKILMIVWAQLALLTTNAQSQLPLDPETKKVTFVELVNEDSLTQEVLYQRTKKWMARYYKSATFDKDDQVAYSLVKTGECQVSLTYDFKYKSTNIVTYTITINQKAGKYRVKMTDFSIYNSKNGAGSKLPLEAAYAKMTSQNKAEVVGQINKEVQFLLQDLKTFIEKGEVTTEEDW